MNVEEIIKQFLHDKITKTEFREMNHLKSWDLTFKKGIMLTWSDLNIFYTNGFKIYGVIDGKDGLIIQFTNKQ